MAPKKGGGKKKSSKFVSDLPPFEYTPPTVHDMGYKPPEYVRCK